MFFREVNEVDLGDMSIPNIFIDIFMPMADGLYVKVYLLGYKNACDPSCNPKFNNNSIAKNLNIPLSDVIIAWKFWAKKGIIKMHKNEGSDDFDYSVEFLDLKKLYLENIPVNTKSIKSNSDSIVSASENPSIRNMFNSINQIIGRYLDPGEKLNILDIINKYNMNCDMIVYAYQHAKDSTGSSKPVKYVESIIRNWYDSNFYTPEDVKNSFNLKSERYSLYKTIFNELGFFRNPSKSEKETIDKWIDNYEMDIELILEACSKSKNVSNPSITYIDGVIKSWNSKYIKNLDDLKKHEDSTTPKITKSKNISNTSNNAIGYKKTKFHNFDETFTQYSAEELDLIIEKSQREKFK